MSITALSSERRHVLIEIMKAALTSVDPAEAVRRHVRREGDRLEIAGKQYDLSDYRRVLVIGFGKAGAPMTEAIAEILGDRVSGGAVVVKYGHTSTSGAWDIRFGAGWTADTLPSPARIPESVELIEAGHPVPDEAGLYGATRVGQIVDDASEHDLVVCLISGGGSALLPAPAPGITLADKQEVTRLLLRCGATINEINTVRKHCSTLKGGQLARRAAPATVVSLILSDVVGSPLDVIASGPTVPDRSTFKEALALLARYGLLEEAPESVVTHLRKGAAGEIAETPKEGDPCFARVHNVIIADNRIAARAAAERARELGLHSQVLTTFAEGEAREIARLCAAIAKEELQTSQPLSRPACVILGGETTVTVRGQGKGGRNQELALAAAIALDGWPDATVASLGTDGTDGPTDAAGALATGLTCQVARGQGMDPLAALDQNDSYTFFSRIGDLIITGPTNTNVNDLIFCVAWA